MKYWSVGVMGRRCLVIVMAWSIGILSACAMIGQTGSDIRTIDHMVQHVSTVPANKGQSVSLFVREKMLAGESATPRPVVLMVHGGVSPSTLAFDVEHETYSWMAYLARAGFDVFAMDMTGYGKSSRPKMDDPCNVGASLSASGRTADRGSSISRSTRPWGSRY